ncbi:hypothetical protein D3C85_631930 [compost metagenome]
MKTSHVLEVTAHPYSLGNPRIYYAKDYTPGFSGVWNNGIYWEVEVVNNTVMFVNYEENEKEMLRLAKAEYCTSIVPSTQTVKQDGVIVGYKPTLKTKIPGEKPRTLWIGEEVYKFRDIGPESAKYAANKKKFELRNS